MPKAVTVSLEQRVKQRLNKDTTAKNLRALLVDSPLRNLDFKHGSIKSAVRNIEL